MHLEYVPNSMGSKVLLEFTYSFIAELSADEEISVVEGN